MPKIIESIDMEGNEITNCKTIESLEKRISGLEEQVQVLIQFPFTKEEIERLKSWAKRVR